jgi:hypothetical protein
VTRKAVVTLRRNILATTERRAIERTQHGTGGSARHGRLSNTNPSHGPNTKRRRKGKQEQRFATHRKGDIQADKQRRSQLRVLVHVLVDEIDHIACGATGRDPGRSGKVE